MREQSLKIEVPVKLLGFEIIFPVILHGRYRMIRSVISFRAPKIDIKCKRLSHFAAVTSRALFYVAVNSVSVFFSYLCRVSILRGP